MVLKYTHVSLFVNAVSVNICHLRFRPQSYEIYNCLLFDVMTWESIMRYKIFITETRLADWDAFTIERCGHVKFIAQHTRVLEACSHSKSTYSKYICMHMCMLCATSRFFFVRLLNDECHVYFSTVSLASTDVRICTIFIICILISTISNRRSRSVVRNVSHFAGSCTSATCRECGHARRGRGGWSVRDYHPVAIRSRDMSHDGSP